MASKTFEGTLYADSHFSYCPLYLKGAGPSGSDLWIEGEVLAEFVGKRVIITVEVADGPGSA